MLNIPSWFLQRLATHVISFLEVDSKNHLNIVRVRNKTYGSLVESSIPKACKVYLKLRVVSKAARPYSWDLAQSQAEEAFSSISFKVTLRPCHGARGSLI